MVSAARYFLAFLLAAIVGGCETESTTLRISKTDRVNPWFGPQKHYEHVVRDSHGQIKDVYRYYLDEQGRPVLDGDRLIYRWEHDAGHIIIYRDGHVVSESDVITTG
jgi:hypothetical protein